MGEITRLKEVSRLMREAREKAGLSKKELSTKLGVSLSTISKWERQGDAEIFKLDKWFFECGARVNVRFVPNRRRRDMVPKENICEQCDNKKNCTAMHEVGLVHAKEHGKEQGKDAFGLSVVFCGEVPESCPYIVEHAVNQ